MTAFGLNDAVNASATKTVPASYAQERLWFVEQFVPGSAAYNIPVAMRITVPLHLGALETAVTELVRRHESLRTTFTVENGRPHQVIGAPERVSISLVDLQGYPLADRHAVAERLATEEARRSFDLGHGPLLRCTLLRLAPVDHVFLLTIHHIVADGWSIGILFRELGVLYDNCCSGRPSALPELPMQYGDFAVWQRQWLQGDVLDRLRGYWIQQLSGAPSALDIPTDRPRPPVQTLQGALVPVTVPPSVAGGIKELARRENATLFMILLAAFATLLHRYSGQSAIVIGTPIANRTRAELEPLIGFFVNTLPIRTDLVGDPSFRQLVRRVREVTIEAYEHQDLPFEKLVEELQPARSLNRTPLFQVMFVLQNLPGNEQHEAPVEPQGLPPVQPTPGTAKFDLTLSLTETPSGLHGALEYSTDLFEHATAERMVHHFQQLVSSITTDPDGTLSSLPLVDEEERRQLFVRARGLHASRPSRPVHAVIQERVDATPNAIAVTFGSTAWTYAELDTRANILANHLRALGVGPECSVGICMERSLEQVVAILATMKAGAAWMPIEPMYPAARVAFMLRDARPLVVLTQKDLESALAPHGVPVITLDQERLATRSHNRRRPAVHVAMENIAYLIYTSGSTGAPKGVMVEHAALANHMQWLQDTFPLTTSDRVLQKTPCSFDVSIWEFLWPLMTGARLVLAPPGAHRESDALVRTIVANGITTLYFVASALQAFLEQPDVKTCTSIRRIFCGGEVLPPVVQERCEELLPGDLHNIYGPAETAIDVTWWTCERGARYARVPIGRPIHNTRLYVLDHRLELSAIGTPGEIYIGGPNVGRGYVGRPDLTAERFVPDPFGDGNADRLYRTGDLGRVLPSGVVEYLGRVDDQVKIHGHRIELGEIDSVLMRVPGVREAAVVVPVDSDGLRRLIAYVVLSAPERTIAALRQYCKDHLPEYMVPTAFVPLDRLPRTPSGKVDRATLAQRRTPVELETEYVTPRTPIETRLASIWTELLRRPHIGINDNFFELGGHSLVATQMVARVRDAFNVDLPLRTVFETPTVEGLARVIGELRGDFEAVDAESFSRYDESGALVLSEAPVSFAQERLWFLDRLQPGLPLYNVSGTARVHWSVDVDVFQRALDEIARRHDILRTAFTLVKGTPMQVVSPPTKMPLSVVDCREIASNRREVEASRIATEEARRPFDLTESPLARVVLIRLGDVDSVLLVVMHHLIADEWSLDVFFREFGAIYDAYAGGRPSPLPALPLQYADVARWQRAQLDDAHRARLLTYWTRQLANLPGELPLPANRRRPPVQSHSGNVRRFELSVAIRDALKRTAQQVGATLFMALLAGWKGLLYRYTGVTDLVVGTPLTNRNRVEFEQLIGLFLNTVVLRTRVSGDLSFRQLVSRVRDVCLAAFSHQDLPFERLVEALRPDRRLSAHPLFQVMFTMQASGMSPPDMGGAIHIDTGTSKFDLLLTMAETSHGLAGTIEYSTDLFDAVTIDRMVGHLTTLLESAVRDPNGQLRDLRILTPPEVEQLAAWNAPTSRRWADVSVDQLFLRSVAQNGHRVALEGHGQDVTYAALDHRAERVADHLRALGVGPDVRVAVCLSRSARTIACLLGILKAGGAIVPLEPTYPAERLEYILRNSRAAVLLTEKSPEPSHVTGYRTVSVETCETPVRRMSSRARHNMRSLDHLAYVVYTSGSTGRPKGVAMPHRAFGNLITWQLSRPGFRRHARTALLTPFSFDVSLQEIFATLCSGGTLVVPPPDARSDPAVLVRFCCSKRIERVFLPYVGLEELARIAVAADSVPEALIEIITAGEQLQVRSSLVSFMDRLPHATLYNQYGPSETHVATEFPLTGAPDSWPALPPIGRPIAGTHVYILDRDLNPVPIGVQGEIHLGGASLARGYLEAPDLTAERFVPDPREGTAGGRLYRSGDLGKYLPDGTIEFLGRDDDQVKIRGFRVELAEVEAVLHDHPAVRACACALRRDTPVGPHLVACVVGAGQVTAEDLRRHLSRLLPDYMIPSQFIFTDTLPLTPSGKIDRAAVATLSQRSAPKTCSTKRPRTQMEKMVARIWCSVLALDAVGVHDNFFALGGHSLLAIRVATELGEAFGVEVPVRRIFESPTVTEQARAILEAQVARHGAEQAEELLTAVERLSDAQAHETLETTQ